MIPMFFWFVNLLIAALIGAFIYMRYIIAILHHFEILKDMRYHLLWIHKNSRRNIACSYRYARVYWQANSLTNSAYRCARERLNPSLHQYYAYCPIIGKWFFRFIIDHRMYNCIYSRDYQLYLIRNIYTFNIWIFLFIFSSYMYMYIVYIYISVFSTDCVCMRVHADV